MASKTGPAAQEALIKAVGKELFSKLEAAAMVEIKADARLCAAPKIRQELAYEAALRAIGFPYFRIVPKETKERPIPAEFQVICDEAIFAGTAAAYELFQQLKKVGG